MLITKGEMLFYGTDDMCEKLDGIIKILNLENQCFEIKLIMSEAINNAFIHGNKNDKNKPISVEWNLEDNLLKLYITDCGCGFKDFEFCKEINEENIFEESGRGLYIIGCYTDEIKLRGSTIMMKKYIS